MRPFRHAMTLIEMLVVLGIVGTLISLLLPAVQRARAAGERAACANNLRQIGLSLHSYHDGHGALPPGFTSAQPERPFPRMTWLARVLPYVEQSALWEQTVAAYEFDPVPSENPPHIGFGIPQRVFSCPTDTRTASPQLTHGGLRPALTSYVGVLGTDCEHANGVLFLGSQVRLTDITDGTSNTLMVGERPPSADLWYGWWYTGYGQAGTGSADMLLGVRERNLGGQYVSMCPPGPYRFQPGRLDVQADLFHFWSLHPGGANFLLADGAVHFMAYSADEILPALATRSNGEPVQFP